MFKLKSSVYAAQDPTHPVHGLYFRLDSELPKLRPLDKACLAPHSKAGLEWLATKAAAHLQGIPHEIVRVDA